MERFYQNGICTGTRTGQSKEKEVSGIFPGQSLLLLSQLIIHQ